jgi:hypothetical protein
VGVETDRALSEPVIVASVRIRRIRFTKTMIGFAWRTDFLTNQSGMSVAGLPDRVDGSLGST